MDSNLRTLSPLASFDASCRQSLRIQAPGSLLETLRERGVKYCMDIPIQNSPVSAHQHIERPERRTHLLHLLNLGEI
jgi:hypothetical protein